MRLTSSRLRKKLGFKDLAALRASLKSNPKLHPASGEALLNAYRGYLTPMQAKLPTLFGRLPKAAFEVAAVPDYLEKTSASAYYEMGAPDGSRPGRLRINTWNARDRNLFEVESTAYHEGIPGHHMQDSISQEQTGVPEFRKYEFYTAFGEGWRSTPSGWERISDSTRIHTPITDVWREIRSGQSGWWSTRGCMQSIGPASRWWTFSTITRQSRKPKSNPRWTVTSRGPARPWLTRSGS